MPMQIVTSPQSHLLRWAQDVQRFKGAWQPDAAAMGIADADGRLRAVVVATNWKVHECHLHIASDGSRSFIRRDHMTIVFRWLFDLKRLRRVTAEVSAHNISVQVLCIKAGFVFEGRRVSGMVDGSDAIVLGMTADQCRWIKEA